MTRRQGNAIKLMALFAVPGALLAGLWALLGGGVALAAILGLAGAAGAAAWLVGSAVLPLRAMAARPATEVTEPHYFALVKELSMAAGVPMPRLYVSPAPAPNAFTTGRGPRTASICVTRGLLDLLTPAQLRAVLAHELMHIVHRDLASASLGGVLAALVGLTVGSLAYVSSRGRTGLVTMASVGSAVSAVMTLITLGLARGREYAADAGAARLTGDPHALAGALEAIALSAASQPLPDTTRFVGVSRLMIANPFRPQSSHLLSSHPDTRARVARLRASRHQR